jgi:beta-glucanase (GH16 family)
MRLRALILATAAMAGAITSASSTRAAGTWKLSFSDDFNGTSINEASWSVYGKGGPIGPFCRDDNNVVVGGGMVTLEVRPSSLCNGYTTGGMCACKVTTQTYGKYEVRMKATPGNSKITFLLWAAVNWPPEIDFAEFPNTGDGAARQHFNQTLHYSDANLMIHSSTDADMTVWHTVGLEWSPGKIVYTLDGVPTTTLTEHVPNEDMWMGLQTAAKADWVPIESADTYIDWVHVYTYTG